jgi:hypothetical protein
LSPPHALRPRGDSRRNRAAFDDDEIRVDSHDEQALREQMVDHEQRLQVLEQDYAQRAAEREHRR